ncbi:hypothetical protein [Nevskia ramosa]|uniref:hypothetical protein n=1 Tax=Nevskia ramosa TaxID=64002 RepID=UPI002354F1B9|nr:hypothetical protein [Nevskia ramosa]
MSAPEPAWITLLRQTAAQLGQPKTAELIGYSTAVVCSVLKGTYKGDWKRVEERVKGALMGVEVDCPVLGPLARDRCLDNQRAPFAATNPTRVQLWHSCKSCSHNLGSKPAGGKS